jgi:hypothetical protein
MRPPRRPTILAAALLASAVLAPAMAAADPSHEEHSSTQHVLLLSIDGLHQADLTWYVTHHPQSALAALVHRGVDFTRASSPRAVGFLPGHACAGHRR